MELRLQKFIEQVMHISDLQNMDAENPIVLRLSNPSIAKVTVIALAMEEPTVLVLPLNVVWVNFDPTSTHYKQALQRVSKDASATYEHTWQVLDAYDDVFVNQYYTEEDLALLTGFAGVSLASQTTFGIARLSLAAADPSDPIVVGDNDPRLTNARPPTAHTHPVQPTEQLQSSTTVVTVNTAQAPQTGQVLYAISPTAAEWRFLTNGDIH